MVVLRIAFLFRQLSKPSNINRGDFDKLFQHDFFAIMGDAITEFRRSISDLQSGDALRSLRTNFLSDPLSRRAVVIGTVFARSG